MVVVLCQHADHGLKQDTACQQQSLLGWQLPLHCAADWCIARALLVLLRRR
jgi:hypothetical protein